MSTTLKFTLLLIFVTVLQGAEDDVDVDAIAGDCDAAERIVLVTVLLGFCARSCNSFVTRPLARSSTMLNNWRI